MQLSIWHVKKGPYFNLNLFEKKNKLSLEFTPDLKKKSRSFQKKNRPLTSAM
jgi:hypothetical protein